MNKHEASCLLQQPKQQETGTNVQGLVKQGAVSTWGRYPLGKLKWVKGRPTSATQCFLPGIKVLALKAVADGTFVPSSNTIFGSLSCKTLGYIWIPGTGSLTWSLWASLCIHCLGSHRLSPMLCSLPATEQLNWSPWIQLPYQWYSQPVLVFTLKDVIMALNRPVHQIPNCNGIPLVYLALFALQSYSNRNFLSL